MEHLPIILAGTALLFCFFFATRLLKSPFWKRRQLRKASLMAARGNITAMTGYLRANMDRGRVSCPLTNALVYFYIRSGDLDSAEKIVTDAMGRGDSSGGALAQLAYIAQGRSEWENAEKLYRKAMEAEPSLAPTLGMNIAGSLIQRNTRLDEAEDLLNQALDSENGPSRSSVHLNLAMLNSLRGSHSQAKVHALTAYELMQDLEITRLGRAQALGLAAGASRKMKDPVEAARLSQKALKVMGDLSGAERLRTELQEMAGS
ncbi:MAG: hypothetical protein R6V62_00950 [Candidatus Fermentibacteraceae bacterium]